MPELDVKRLFLAVEIPKKIGKSLEALENILKETACDARWVKPANVHLTLKFLGDVRTEKITPIIQALTSAFPSKQSFNAALNELGGFPSLKSLQILWAGINDSDKKITALASTAENALYELGFKKETKEFRAHLTLARLRSNLNKLQLIEKVRKINKTMQPEIFPIDNITLFESHLTTQGPIYSHIHQIKFR
ncbi:MAG: RNA 2',3'-cyclic phosphodiesterase [Candidatus Omnitrophota bacterium]